MLGLTSAEENREVEALADEHESIRAEIASIQAALETYATQFAQQPPASLKSRVMVALEELEGNQATVTVPSDRPFIVVEKNEEELTHATDQATGVIPLAEAIQTQNRYRFWTAAASILLGVSILANLFLFSHWKKTETQLAEVTAAQSQLAQQNKEMRQQMTVVSNPDYKILNLQTTDPARSAEVVVYWHPHNGNLYIAASKLPPLPKGKKYQLWAIVNNTPVDAGVFAPQADGLMPMKQMPRAAQAFAVTMEDENGSQVPTMPIYVQAAV